MCLQEQHDLSKGNAVVQKRKSDSEDLGVLSSRFQGLAGTRKRGCCIAKSLDTLFVDSVLKQQGRQRARPICGNISALIHW